MGNPMAEEKQSVETTPTQDSSNHRATKGERKFRKAMTKMGMKPVEGITRVTLKTNKNFILYIDKPDVMKTSNDSSYLVFGEAKFTISTRVWPPRLPTSSRTRRSSPPRLRTAPPRTPLMRPRPETTQKSPSPPSSSTPSAAEPRPSPPLTRPTEMSSRLSLS